MHETAVASRLALLERLDRHVTKQAAGAVHLKAVGKKLHLNLAAANEATVVTVRDRIEQGFADRSPRVLGNVGAQQAIDACCRGDPAHDVSFGLVDHLDDRPLELLVVEEALATRTLLLLVATGILQECDHQLRFELLRVHAEGKQAAQGRMRNSIDFADDTEGRESLLLRRAQGARSRPLAPQLLDECGNALGVKIADSRGGDGLLIKGRLRTGAHISEDLIGRHALR